MNKQSILCILILGCLLSCKMDSNQREPKGEALVQFTGETMGTYYNVKYLDPEKRNLKPQIDSILFALNQEVSTYIPTSTISLFNAKDTMIRLATNSHFLRNLLSSITISEQTSGYFDPTVMPLVNYWGFGYKGKKALDNVDSLAIREIMDVIGMDKIKLEVSDDHYLISKASANAELDFSAIAKGYGVDILAHFLRSKDIKNYLVEIGGENIARGVNQKGRIWTVGINTPKEGAELDDLIMAVRLENKAIATSGDYRQYYVIDGKKYSHEIDPKTGYPKTSPLVSVSVLASTCAEADAYATAFIVMGLEKASELVEKIDKLEACFIVTDEEEGYKKIYSSGFAKNIVE